MAEERGTEADATHVVTVFLRHEGAVLLLRRSEAVGSYSGQWGAVAGHAEGDPDAAAREEVREETGLDPASDASLVRRGDPFAVVDEDLGRRWVVHPYLFDCATRAVTTNYETAACEWVPPTAVLRRETVPDLWTSYDRVRPTVETVAADREHGSAYLSLRALEVLRDEAALAVERERGSVDLAATARALRDARPAMPVVENRVNRAMCDASERADAGTTENGEGEEAAGMTGETGGDGYARAVEAAAVDELDRALAADDRAAERAAERLPEQVATLSQSGTVRRALDLAGPASVLVAESRPGREGVDTAEHLARETGAEVTLTTDAALADRLAGTDVAALVVGADAVLPDGRVVNKVGTRGAATVAAYEGIDVVVVAASDKVAPAGDGTVDREERDPGEVYDGDADLAVANPTFDATPAGAVDAVVTEEGILDAGGVRDVAERHRERAEWNG